MDKEFYKNLIPIKNYSKMRYMAYLDAVLSHGTLLGTMIETMPDAFDLDNAAGNQLDTIGELVGIDRLLPYVPTMGTREMTDDEYRTIIKLKIGRNTWDGTNEGAIEIYRQFLGSLVAISYEDNQDGTVTFSIGGSSTTREAELLQATGNLLVPAGVSYTVNFVGDNASVQILTGAAVTSETTNDYIEMLSEESDMTVGIIEQMYVSVVERKDVWALER